MLAKLIAWAKTLLAWGQALLKALLMRIYLPGMQGLPLYPILMRLQRDMTDRAFVLNSFAMAYSFFLSIFPTLIFLFSILPFVPIPQLDTRMMQALAEVLPKEAYVLLESTFLGILQERDIGRLSFSLLIVLFLGVRGVSTMANAFNSMDKLHRKDRNWLQSTWVGVSLFLTLLFMGALATVVFVLGEIWIARFNDANGMIGVLQYTCALLASRALLLAILLATLNIIYRRAPTYDYRWRLLSPGSLLAAILLLGAIWGLNLYFTNFSNYNNIYGSLGAVIMLMVLFYWISFVLQTGFHLNSSIEEVVQAQKQWLQQRNDATRAEGVDDELSVNRKMWAPGKRLY